jgi:acetyl esterase
MRPASTADSAPPPTLGERLTRGVVLALGALPPAAQVRLSGKPPVCVDGNVLAPEMQLTLSLLARRGELSTETLSPDEARRERRRRAAVFAGKPEPVGAVADLEIEAEVPLRARHYAPLETGGADPVLVFFHGGGFTYGDLDTHDGVCRLLCRHAGAHVLAIDYRLAPEHPFPAAVEDARAALSWASAQAHELGADPGCVGVGGDSAGGNLAAVVSQLAARDGGPVPVLQLLIYPATDCTRRRRSRELFGEGFFLTSSEMDWFEANYLGSVGGANCHDPRASPLIAKDLSGLAPAIVVTAGFDPLRDEGEEYADAMRAAGTPTLLRRFPAFLHGFIGAAGVSRACRDAVVEIAGATRAMFASSRKRGAGRTAPETTGAPV